MNLFNILEQIEKADPDFQDRISPRRDAIKNITSFGSKVALAAAPAAFVTLFKKAYGQTPTRTVSDVLNYALILEYFEAYLYNTGNSTPAMIRSADKAYFTTLGTQENEHVVFLQGVLGTGNYVTKPADNSYDLTAGGTFGDIYTNPDTYYGVTQVVEDTGVRAYKGQAGYLAGALNKIPLTAALSIHAVEARHASAIRQIRHYYGGVAANLTPWIIGANDTGLGAPVDGNYVGEDNTLQGNPSINVITLSSAYGSTTPVGVATAAFDEPLSTNQVAALVLGFGVIIPTTN